MGEQGRSLTISREVVVTLPALIEEASGSVRDSFLEFFIAKIRNPNTRLAYGHAVGRFLSWCEERGLALGAITPVIVGAYIEQHPGSAPTVKLHLSAIRQLFDHLVASGSVGKNPATSVKGPRHIVKKGKTMVLSGAEAKALIEAIDTATLIGLRDRALIGVMVYSFARIGAVLGMRVMDYEQRGRRGWLRLTEKGGKHHEVPAHHQVEEYLDAYIAAAGIGNDKNGPLFRSAIGCTGRLSGAVLDRSGALYMVKRRAASAGLGPRVSNHTFRATGITVYLKSGGTLENAQAIAAHESPSTTKLYDRRSDEIDLAEIERIHL